MKNELRRFWTPASVLGLVLLNGCATVPTGLATSAGHRASDAEGETRRAARVLSPARSAEPTVIRGQQPYAGSDLWGDYPTTPGSNGQPRQPIPVSGTAATAGTGRANSVHTAQLPGPATGPARTASPLPPPPGAAAGGRLPYYDDTVSLPAPSGSNGQTWSTGIEGGLGDVFSQPPEAAGVIDSNFPPARPADVIITGQEAQTGRFMFGAGINSDAGFTFQVVLDEQNFDWRKPPRSLDDVIDGRAFRGGGQRLRLEAMPGNQVERYLFNFTDPYWRDTPISLNVSGFLFDRRYFDWDERRLGGRLGLGYRLTPDVSLSVGVRGENVEVHNPRRRGVPELEDVLGNSDLFGGRVTLTHDTRDRPFAATEGHYLELTYEQVFGDYDYPRGTLDYRRYFLLHERPDQSGRHTLGSSFQAGVTGSNTPLFENFFAGGYSTLRGFRFRGASPKVNDVTVGGELSLLGSLEYMFPISADDMIKGVFFTDYGTVEENINIDWNDFRVAVGFGLRFTVPAMGPAPIAVDLAVPLNHEETDRIQNFSFFVGTGR